jgi:hypothetical protein
MMSALDPVAGYELWAGTVAAVSGPTIYLPVVLSQE